MTAMEVVLFDKTDAKDELISEAGIVALSKNGALSVVTP